MAEHDELEKKYLEDWRLARYWSQSDLAKEAGVNQSVISRIERGEIVGRFGTLVKIANALGIKPEQVLEFAPKFEPKKDLPLTALINGSGKSDRVAAIWDIAATLA